MAILTDWFFFFVQVCGHELMAHRAVLACCSPYLFEIFNSDIEPHGVSHVTFEDLEPEAVEILLNYAYTAQLVTLLTFASIRFQILSVTNSLPFKEVDIPFGSFVTG